MSLDQHRGRDCSIDWRILSVKSLRNFGLRRRLGDYGDFSLYILGRIRVFDDIFSNFITY